MERPYFMDRASRYSYDIIQRRILKPNIYAIFFDDTPVFTVSSEEMAEEIARLMNTAFTIGFAEGLQKSGYKLKEKE